MTRLSTFWAHRSRHWLKQVWVSVVFVGMGLSFMNTTPIASDQADSRSYTVSSLGSVRPLTFSSRNLTNELSVDVVRFRSLNQDFGTSQLEHSTEAHTNLSVNYKVKNKLFMTSDMGFSYSKQAIRTMSSVTQVDRRTEKMFYGSLGVQKIFLRNLMLQGNAGLVRSRQYSSGESQVLPTASVMLAKTLKKTHLSFALASQAMGGGSFTGMYGNQILNHGKLGLGFQISERFQIESSLAYGQTRSVFEGSQKANILASSIQANYNIVDRLEASVGFFHRNITNAKKFDAPVSEGAMISASMAFTY
jgi:hypothetical protein